MAGLPYVFEVSRYDSRAFLIASKYRLSGSTVVYYDGLPLIVETTIHLPSGAQPLWVVHTAAPVHDSFAEWQNDAAFIARSVKDRGPQNLLLVGDFNSTWGNKGFRSILDEGMTDGAAARGQALDMTWSQLLHPLPPFVRIDHVLTGPGVAVTTIRTDDGVGSDHRDVLATVAFEAIERASAGGNPCPRRLTGATISLELRGLDQGYNTHVRCQFQTAEAR